MDDSVSWAQVAGPIVLFFIMAVVGLELTPGDFRRVARYPRTVVYGTLAQWTLLPAITGLLLLAFDLEPHLAAGLVLLTASPGGGSSNVFTYLAGANTALSVTLTAITSVFTALVLPLLTAGGFQLFVGPEAIGQMPVLEMFGQLVLFVLVPIGFGMWLRQRRRDWVARHGLRLRRAVLVGMVAVLVAGMAGDDSGLFGELVHALVPAVLWTLAAFACGWVTATLLDLDVEGRFTFGIEFSVKNVGLAAIVALSGFQRPEFAVFAGAYIVTGYPMAVLAAVVFRRFRKRAAALAL